MTNAVGKATGGASFDRPREPVLEPSPWVERWSKLIRPGGRVLDVAAGHGRHTRLLAGTGFGVTAVDIDSSGLADLSGHPNVAIIVCDLETGDWPFDRRFDGIIVANYLHRPHFPHLIASLAEGGVLIFDTFAEGNERLGRPRNPAFLLAPGELLQAFGGALTVVAYESGEEREPRPAVRQRICAVRGPGPWPLV